MMKKMIHLLSASLFALCVLFSASCKKSTTSGGNQNLGAGQSEVRFSYSGAQSGSFQSSLALSLAASNGGITQIAGNQVVGTSAKVVQIIFPTSVALGASTQASAGADLANGFLLSFAIGGDGWGIGGGTATNFTVTITKNTGTEMEGTFSGELGSDSNPSKVTVTDGYFHCKL